MTRDTVHRPFDQIDEKFYKGYRLHLCWCGYPETRWLVMLGNKYIGTRLHLKDAKALVNSHRLAVPA